jgi:hypothetical protein
MKISVIPFVSFPTRFEALDAKATNRASAEIDAGWLEAFPSTPA